MPRLLAGPTGLYAYPNAGVNDAAAIGNLLSGLAETGLKFHTLRQENRTIGDLVGKPGMVYNDARDRYTPPEVSLRDRMANSLRSLSGKPQAMMQPAPMPMATPGQMNPLQSLVYGSGLQNFKMRDMKSLGEVSPFLKLLTMGDEDQILKQITAKKYLSEIEKNNALAQKTKQAASAAGSKTTDRMQQIAWARALSEIQADPLYGMAETDEELDDQENRLQQIYQRNLRVLSGGSKPKPSGGKASKKDSLGLFK